MSFVSIDSGPCGRFVVCLLTRILAIVAVDVVVVFVAVFGVSVVDSVVCRCLCIVAVMNAYVWVVASFVNGCVCASLL